MSKQYTVMDEESLHCYKMTDNEKTLVEELRKECIKICNKLHVPRGKCVDGSPYMERLRDSWEFEIKYKSEIGYFALDGERGVYSIREGFPEHNKDKAKCRLLSWEFETGGFQYELQSRNKLECLWKKQYKVDYDSRKAAFEYAIQKHVTVTSCIIDEEIDRYTAYMNRWFEVKHWVFNREGLLFEEVYN